MAYFLINVVGPTAIGKTALAIKLARHFNTEIISADSRQFFKEMNIGTAVPSAEELAAVPHHFIQHISVEEDYSVGDFERDAIAKLEVLFQKHQVVVMVGGSGLYIKGVTEGLDYFPKVAPEIREKLKGNFEEKGLAPLQNQLKQLDPQYYTKADLENPHRVIRALEICLGTGKAYSSFLNQKKKKRKFETISIGLEAERKLLYSRINERVDNMMEEGLFKEAETLFPNREFNALNTVGYKELFAYLEGKTDLKTAVTEIKKNTRHFAKRQLTWFRKDKNIRWFSYTTSPNEVIAFIEEKITS